MSYVKGNIISVRRREEERMKERERALYSLPCRYV